MIWSRVTGEPFRRKVMEGFSKEVAFKLGLNEDMVLMKQMLGRRSNKPQCPAGAGVSHGHLGARADWPERNKSKIPWTSHRGLVSQKEWPSRDSGWSFLWPENQGLWAVVIFHPFIGCGFRQTFLFAEFSSLKWRREACKAASWEFSRTQ